MSEGLRIFGGTILFVFGGFLIYLKNTEFILGSNIIVYFLSIFIAILIMCAGLMVITETGFGPELGLLGCLFLTLIGIMEMMIELPLLEFIPEEYRGRFFLYSIFDNFLIPIIIFIGGLCSRNKN